MILQSKKQLSVNETLVVNPGENVTVHCFLTGGDPQPQVLWSHGPGPLPLGSRAQGGTLTIPSVQAQDSGYYNCTAINNVGNPAKKTVNLLVRCKNATFQITPDVIKESESIQLGQDLKLSCHVDAVPQEKVSYQWFKNGKLARVSDRLLVTRNDPELPAVTSSLELIDLRFSDYGECRCQSSWLLELHCQHFSINHSSMTSPPLFSHQPSLINHRSSHYQKPNTDSLRHPSPDTDSPCTSIPNQSIMLSTMPSTQ
uniref:Ig-like domain-containing protein n=1 Tax=Monodelphis domestica TaxID=13616 RepID=F7GAF9_MONDO